jgi:hypothetical protein
MSPVEASVAALTALLEAVAIADALAVVIAVIGTSFMMDARTVIAKFIGLAVVDGSPVETSVCPLGTLFETVAIADALVFDVAVVNAAGHAGTIVASLVGLAIGMRPVETAIRPLAALLKAVAIAFAKTIG